jgi:UDP-N-acetylglucosamine/UDP-N-acetylgalactosamine diphosphorylase
VALKKTPYLDELGNLTQPDEPNSLKFERFIFDLLPEARHALVIEVEKRKNFVPLKNASGAASDSPEHVRAGLIDIYSQWLSAAGTEVSDGVAVEISPLFALDAAELARKVSPERIESPKLFSKSDEI